MQRNKRKSRPVALLLALLMILGLPMAALAETTEDNAAQSADEPPKSEAPVVKPGEYGGSCGADMWWRLDGATLQIGGAGAMSNYSSPLYTPWYPYRDWIYSVSIGEGVKTIGKNAFRWLTRVTDATLPSELEVISESAFTGCTALERITIPGSVETIGIWAFRSCEKLEQVVIYNGVKYIEEEAFAACPALRDLRISGSVTTIGESAFGGCTALEYVTLPHDLTTVGDSAFIGCTALQAAYFDGAAPSSFGSRVFANCHSSFAIYYYPEAPGWSTPTWNGYEAYTRKEGGINLRAPVLTLVRANAGNVGLTWTAVTDAESYMIFRNTETTHRSQHALTTNLWYTDTATEANETYYYSVVAVHGGGATAIYSPASNQVAANIPAAATLATPVLTLARIAVNNVGLTWRSIPGATGYSVYRGTTAANLTWYASAATPWYSDTATPAGTTWYYQVIAYKNGTPAIYSGKSNVIAANLPAPVSLAAPVLTLARTAVNNVGLTWRAIPGAAGYSIYRGATAANLTWHASAATPWYSDTATPAGTTWYYQVIAYKSGTPVVYSPRSNTVAANIPVSLAAPVLTLNRAVANNVGLTWRAVSGATGYSVYRGTTAGNLAWYARTANPWYSDTATPAGTTWYYQVVAYKSGTPAVYSGRSNTVAANVSVSLAAPVLTLARTAVNNVGLTWTAVPGATDYRVYRGTTAGNLTLLYASVTSPWYSDTVTLAGVTYYYQVVAYNASTTSNRSNTVTANISAAQTPLTAPVLTLVQAAANDVILRWTTVSGATGYNIYRGNTATNLAFYASTSSLQYRDTAAAADMTYYYAVEAYKSGTPVQTGPYSNTVTACTEVISGSCGENATWTLDPIAGVLTISGRGTVRDYGLFGPWHDEYASSIRSVVVQSGITGIGQQAFLDCGAIESITLPDTLTTIGMGAFSSCTALQSIRIPGSVHAIYDSALSFCSNLRSVTFAGNAPTTFGAGVLARCDLNPTIYYYSTKTGWTSPTWNGYPAQAYTP